jgi:TonB family protein
MKKRIITALLFLQFVTGFSQDLDFEIHGKYSHPITRETIATARSMSDIIPYYPASWIKNYISVEIVTTRDGLSVMAGGTNDTLSEEQIEILNSAELGTEIVINIQYQSENSLTRDIENGKVHYSATVIPESEAEYPDGYQQLTQYLKENAIDKISAEDSKKLQQAVVSFTINEEGEIANAQISKTSGDPETDQLLLEVVNKMPKWRPAENSAGIKVKQEFEFSVGNVGC